VVVCLFLCVNMCSDVLGPLSLRTSGSASSGTSAFSLHLMTSRLAAGAILTHSGSSAAPPPSPTPSHGPISFTYPPQWHRHVSIGGSGGQGPGPAEILRLLEEERTKQEAAAAHCQNHPPHPPLPATRGLLPPLSPPLSPSSPPQPSPPPALQPQGRLRFS
jgi:hypothetical protein